MRRILVFSAAALFMQCAILQTANAHFIWLLPSVDKDVQKVDVYFSEAAQPDDPELLEGLQGMTVWRVSAKGKPIKLSLKKTEEALQAETDVAEVAASLFAGRHDYGVITRGEKPFLLRYYAKTGPALTDAAWTNVKTAEQLDLDIVPHKMEDGKLKLVVSFQGKPVVGAEVKGYGPELDEFEASTDKDGAVVVAVVQPGEYGFRAKHVEATAGELDGKKYDDIRHYSTVTFEAEKPEAKVVTDADTLPEIPECVTSFGGAVAGDYLYIYGGHTGAAHSYSHEEQAHTLQRLNLRKPGAWEDVIDGPHLQGLALVPHGDKVYRLGGFTAKNESGEDRDLWSQDSTAGFDPATKKWTDLPALPEPRSSFDAAVLGDTIYVIGGWQMQGDKDAVWHKTAWKLDLSAAKPQWESIPAPPFQRRALAVAAHDGKIFALGGMAEKGGPSRKTNVFDPQSQQWSSLEDLPGEKMAGFGCSAFATGGRLYVSTFDGSLLRLSPDQQHWERVGQLPTARFFHRMLPYPNNSLLIVGGANMGIGKFEEVEILQLD